MAWRDLDTDHDDQRSLREIARDMKMPFRDFSISIEGKPLDSIPTSFFIGVDKASDGDAVVLTGTFTTTMILDDIVDETPLNDEQQEKLRLWWSEKFARDFERQMLGQPTEYENSLRAAGAKV